MAYNLRPRRIIEELLENEGSDEEITEQCDDAVDSDDSEGFSPSSASEESCDIEMEDVSLSQRLNESRARGRPNTKLKGKNGFRWDKRFSTRSSGTVASAPSSLYLSLSIHLYVYIYLKVNKNLSTNIFFSSSI